MEHTYSPSLIVSLGKLHDLQLHLAQFTGRLADQPSSLNTRAVEVRTWSITHPKAAPGVATFATGWDICRNEPMFAWRYYPLMGVTPPVVIQPVGWDDAPHFAFTSLPVEWVEAIIHSLGD